MEKALLKALCLGLILISSLGYAQTGDTINGQVLYHGTFPMNNVDVFLSDDNGNLIATTITNSNGNYTFPNVSPGNYSITYSSDAPASGINLTDAFTILLHCLNLYPFTPIQELAADINGSGSVNFADYTFVLINYLNQGNQFPIGPWVFDSEEVTIGTRTGTGVSSSGSASGDVNGNFVPTKNGNQFCSFSSTETMITSGSTDLPLAIRLNSLVQFGGLHLAIRIPQGIEITGVNGTMEDLNYNLNGDVLKITWLDVSMTGMELNPSETMINITADIKNPKLSEMTYTLELLDESHLIGTDGEIIYGVSLIMPSLKLQPAENTALQIYPNPFFENATIGLQAPESGHLTVVLYDNSGRLVRVIENSVIQPGYHFSTIDGTDLVAGNYYYNISFEGVNSFVKTGTIIKSR